MFTKPFSGKQLLKRIQRELNKRMIVVLSYFNRKVGPLVFYSYPKNSLKKGLSEKIAGIMDQQINEGFFAHSFENLRSLNYYFEIPSDWARGNKEMLMSSIIMNQQISPEIEETNYILLRKFVEKMQSNKDIFTGLYINELSDYDEADKEYIRKNETSIKAWVNNLYWTVMEENGEEFKMDTGKILPLMKDEKPLVLVIAEEPDILNLTKKFLKLGDIETITSSNAKEALKILEERYNEISIVLVDIMMALGAYTLLEEIKRNEKYKHIRVVFIPLKTGDDFRI